MGFSQLSAEVASSLESPFSFEEVKRVVWQCEGSKAPGFDGFNFNFIKKIWHVLAPDFMRLVQYFYDFGLIPRKAQGLLLTLVPKSDTP